MKKFQKLLLALSVAAQISHADPFKVYLDPSLTELERKTFQRDLEFFNSLPDLDTPSDPDTHFRSFLGLSKTEPLRLEPWLSQRFKRVVGASYLREAIQTRVADSHAYPRSIFPDIFEYTFMADSLQSIVPNGAFTMANIGSALYLIGKIFDEKVSVRYGKDASPIDILSPRVGLIAIGEGYFKVGGGIGSAQQAGTRSRVAAWIHEARHSDGNGESLGFAHSKCPKGHDYEGEAVCDLSMNGAYVGETLALRSLLKNCDNCSPMEKTLLQVQIVEMANRFVPSFAEFPDAPQGRQRRNRLFRSKNVAERALGTASTLEEKKVYRDLIKNYPRALSETYDTAAPVQLRYNVILDDNPEERLR